MIAIIYIVLAIIVLIVITILIILYVFPQSIIDATNKYYAYKSKLAKKVVSVHNSPVHYYASTIDDSKKTIVLVHGMGDDKNSFLQTAIALNNKYNIILPDLAGHGENIQDPQGDYSINGQSIFLHDFITILGVRSPILVGNSMGGYSVATYAIAFPNDLSGLVLLNAAGIDIKDFVVYTGFGKNIESDEDFKAVLERVFYTVPNLPGPIKKLMISNINKSKDWVDGTLVPGIKQGKYFDISNDLSKITIPTLILWGKNDKVLKPEMADIFHKNIKNSQITFIEKAGHSPQLEVATEVAHNIDTFVSQELQ